MTTLKNLKGTAIQFRDEDPVLYVGSWASSTAINTNRQELAGSGTATAALAFGGDKGGGSLANETETWNGSSWTEGNNLNTARNVLAGTGLVTASIASGGATPDTTNATELYDGSSWTEVNNLMLSY